MVGLSVIVVSGTEGLDVVLSGSEDSVSCDEVCDSVMVSVESSVSGSIIRAFNLAFLVVFKDVKYCLLQTRIVILILLVGTSLNQIANSVPLIPRNTPISPLNICCSSASASIFLPLNSATIFLMYTESLFVPPFQFFTDIPILRSFVLIVCVII